MTTIENLKARKSYIIAKVDSLSLSSKLASIMGIMKMEVEMGTSKTVYELLMDAVSSVSTTKPTKLAEMCGNGIKANGTEINYQIAKYL